MMELKNLLNTSDTSDEGVIRPQQTTEKQIPANQYFAAGYDNFAGSIKQQQQAPNAKNSVVPQTMTDIQAAQPMNHVPPANLIPQNIPNYMQFSQPVMYPKNYGGIIDPGAARMMGTAGWTNTNVPKNGNLGLATDFSQQPLPFKSAKLENNNGTATLKTPASNDHTSNNNNSVVEKPLRGVAAALQTVQRYKADLIRNEVAVRDGGALNDFPEHPTLLTVEAYGDARDQLQSFVVNWKPEQLEKVYPELFIAEQKAGRDIKKTLAEYRAHCTNLPSEDDIWFAKDIPIMHQASCLNSKKNKNCMGCSPFWNTVQTINEELRPWANSDMLHFESEHSETFVGHVAMNGSYLPPQRSLLACDYSNTLYYADDMNAVVIWGLIPPTDLSKLTDDDCFGAEFFDQKAFLDPVFLEQKARVTYAVQRVGQTIVIPAMWTFFMVRVGAGLSFSASWSTLHVKNVIEARRLLEFNRSLGVYRPINYASLIIAAAYQKLDEYEVVETMQEKQIVGDFLMKLLPVVKVQVLEEVLGDHLSLSSLVVLSYDSVVEKFRRSNIKNLSSSYTNEILQLRPTPLQSLETEVVDEDDDNVYTCTICRTILFNTRRTCSLCKGFEICDSCYNLVGRNHPHKMKRKRKTSVNSLLDLVESLKFILSDHDPTEFKEPRGERERERERERVDRDGISSSSRDRGVKRDRSERGGSERRERDRGDRSERVERVAVERSERLLERADRMERSERSERSERAERDRERNRDGPYGEEDSRGEASESYEEEVIDCICGNNKDLGFMISCEKCFAWLHGKCVGISKRNEPDTYYCPRCVPPGTYRRSFPPIGKLSPRNVLAEERLKEYNLT